MKDAMMRYAAAMLAIGLAFGSSACVVMLDDEGESQCESSSTHEDGGERYANWGWHDDSECSTVDFGDDDESWHDWDNNDADAGGGGGDQGGTNGGDDGQGGGGTDGDVGGGGGDDGGGTDGDDGQGGGTNGGDGGGYDGGGTNGGGGDEDCPVEGKVCGEDGETYESACDASRAHVRVASEGPCLPPCSVDLDCADGSLCEAGSCHEVTCPDLAEDDHSQEVCADDGFTYQTECEARMARLSVAHEGCCVE